MEAFADIEGGVRQAVARIQTTPCIPQNDRRRGGVYDCATGRFRAAPVG